MTQEEIKCPKCLAYYGHYPECELIDFETAKKMLKEYWRAWLKQEELHKQGCQSLILSIKESRKEAEFWKGKFVVVKNENNKLRKKLYPTP